MPRFSFIKSPKFYLLLITALAFAARVHLLGVQCLWDDEAKSIFVASWDIPAIIAEQASHEHPPLHYLLLHSFMCVAGRSEFAARFVSLFFGVLLIPLIYRTAQFVNLPICPFANLLICALAALSPFYVRFAQETRMYTLATFFSLLSVYYFLGILQNALRKPQRPREREDFSYSLLICYAAATAAALYSHYFTAFIIVVQAVYVVLTWRQHRAPLRRLLAGLCGAVVLFTPWIVLMIRGILSIDPALRTSDAAADANSPVVGLVATWLEGRAELVSLPEIFRQCLISFGAGDFLSLAPTLWLTLFFTAILLIGLWHTLVKSRAPFLAIYFVLPLILGYITAFPTNRPLWAKYFSVASPAYYLLLGAGLTALWHWRKWLLWGSAAVICGAFAVSLRNYYFVPEYARTDYRPYIAYLESFSTPDDALLINPWTHFPVFWYYWQRHADNALTVYYPDEWTNWEQELESIAARHSGVWVVKNLPNDFDPEAQIQTWLARRGYLTIAEWQSNMIMRYYSFAPLNVVPKREDFAKVKFIEDNWGQLSLLDYEIAVKTHKYRQIVHLDLLWRARVDVEEPYVIFAHLLDAQGRRWGEFNSPPVGGFAPTTEWRKDDRVLDHLGLLALPGTPPGAYRVAVGVYNMRSGARLTTPDGDSVVLDTITLPASEISPSPAALFVADKLSPELRERTFSTAEDGGLTIAPALRLWGYQFARGEVKPGETLPVTLFWYAAGEITENYKIELQLVDRAGAIWTADRATPGISDYPTARWTVGAVVRDQRELVIPAAAPAAEMSLWVSVRDFAPIEIGTVQLHDRSRNYRVPQIAHPQTAKLGDYMQFLGYDLTHPAAAPFVIERRDTIRLTLHWKCLQQMSTSYTVFAHLIDAENQVWGQMDSVPGRGTLPTTGWRKGEIVSDEYEIFITKDVPLGTYRIEIGMYDAETWERLPVLDDAGNVQGDRVILQTELQIVDDD